MALVDVLEWFPRENKGYGMLRGWFLELAGALRREQDGESGGWWLVMDEAGKGRKGNYIESSGTAMYTYGLLKGVRSGLFASVGEVEREGYVDVARRAYKGMVERFVARNGTGGTLNWEGTVRVGSLDGDGDYKVRFVLGLGNAGGGANASAVLHGGSGGGKLSDRCWSIYPCERGDGESKSLRQGRVLVKQKTGWEWCRHHDGFAQERL